MSVGVWAELAVFGFLVDGLLLMILNCDVFMVDSRMNGGLVAKGRSEARGFLVVVNQWIVNNHSWVNDWRVMHHGLVYHWLGNGVMQYGLVNYWLGNDCCVMQLVNHWLGNHNRRVMHDRHGMMDDFLGNRVDVNVVTSVLVNDGRFVVDGLVVVMGLMLAVLDLVVGVRGPVVSAVWLVFCTVSVFVVVCIVVRIIATSIAGTVCTVSVSAADVNMMSFAVVAIAQVAFTVDMVDLWVGVARCAVILGVLEVLSLGVRLVMVVLGLEVALMSLRERLLVVFAVIDVHLDGLFLMWSDQRAVVPIEVHLGVGVCRLPVFPIEIAVMTVGRMSGVAWHVIAYGIRGMSVTAISAMRAVSKWVSVGTISAISAICAISGRVMVAGICVTWVGMMSISVAMSAIRTISVRVGWNRNDSVVRMRIHTAVVVRRVRNSVVLRVCPVLDWVVLRAALPVAVHLLVMPEFTLVDLHSILGFRRFHIFVMRPNVVVLLS